MSKAVLSGKTREVGRKGPSRALRAEGLLPGIVYGQGENVPVTVNVKEVKKVLGAKGGKNSIIKTSFDGDSKERVVMIKSLDVHPIYDTLLHIDFMEIDVNKPTTVDVTLDFTGTAVGVKDQGGKMTVTLRALTIECLPEDIPDSIEIVVENMEIDEVWQVKDLKLDPNLTVLNPPDARVVSIAEPKAIVEETVEEDELLAAEGAEGAEGAAEGAEGDKAPAEPESADKKE